MPDIADLKRDIKRLRDELELKMHLASMEAREEWQELEGKWERFSSRARLEDTSEGVGDALEQLGDEIKRGYKNLRAALRD